MNSSQDWPRTLIPESDLPGSSSSTPAEWPGGELGVRPTAVERALLGGRIVYRGLDGFYRDGEAGVEGWIACTRLETVPAIV